MRLTGNIFLLFSLFVFYDIFIPSSEAYPNHPPKLLHRVKRIIGGEQASRAEWPWLVSIEGKIPAKPLFFFIPREKRFLCGASVLNDRWLITAAHCFGDKAKNKEPRYWKAILGTRNRKSTAVSWLMHAAGRILNKPEWLRYRIRFDKIIIHPNYDKDDDWFNDIALIRLSSSVPSGVDVDTIQSIKLPEQGNITYPPDGTKCHMAGWGCQSLGGGGAENAHDVVLPKVSDNICKWTYGVSTETRLCAGGNSAGRGICSGDSGGPLMCHNNQHWVLIGIASFTSASRPSQFPGAFTRVAAYTDWINTQISQNS